MSRVRERRVFWVNPNVPDFQESLFYAGASDIQNFVAQVDAGAVAPLARIPGEPGEESQIILGENTGLEEGTYQFAVVAQDSNGNFSDPLQVAAWTAVPLDLTPPPPPTGGGIAFVNN